MHLEVSLCNQGHDDKEYLARVAWLSNGYLIAQMQNRAQKKLKLLRFDLLTGRKTKFLIEKSDILVNCTIVSLLYENAMESLQMVLFGQAKRHHSDICICMMSLHIALALSYRRAG